MAYLRPPKKPAGNVSKDTPLGLLRNGILKQWTFHGTVDHDWGGYHHRGNGALAVIECPLCKEYGQALYDTERDTPENQL